MKLWELFNEKYIGRNVTWTKQGEEYTGYVGQVISNTYAIFETGEKRSVDFTQHDIQTIDFKLEPKELTFDDLKLIDLYAVKLMVKYETITITGEFGQILPRLSSHTSDVAFNILTKGKWYILEE